MQRYAIKIRKSDLPLITILNGGVTPAIEKQPTYLIFSAEDDNLFSEIVTQRELDKRFEVKQNGPLLFALKK